MRQHIQKGYMSANASEQLVNQALEEVSESKSEIEQSEKIAETLAALQGVIERNAKELISLNQQVKEKREMLKNMIENDNEVAEAEQKAQALMNEVKEKKAKIASDPAQVALKLQLSELAQNKKEIEETLSSHLVNYHQLTGSTSFDTSDGDQWEFKISARVKPIKT